MLVQGCSEELAMGMLAVLSLLTLCWALSDLCFSSSALQASLV